MYSIHKADRDKTDSAQIHGNAMGEGILSSVGSCEPLPWAGSRCVCDGSAGEAQGGTQVLQAFQEG